MIPKEFPQSEDDAHGDFGQSNSDSFKDFVDNQIENFDNIESERHNQTGQLNMWKESRTSSSEREKKRQSEKDFEDKYDRYFPEWSWKKIQKESPKIGDQYQVTKFPVLKLGVNAWNYNAFNSENKQFKGKIVWSINEFEKRNNASRDDLEKSLDEYMASSKKIVQQIFNTNSDCLEEILLYCLASNQYDIPQTLNFLH